MSDFERALEYLRMFEDYFGHTKASPEKDCNICAFLKENDA